MKTWIDADWQEDCQSCGEHKNLNENGICKECHEGEAEEQWQYMRDEL